MATYLLRSTSAGVTRYLCEINAKELTLRFSEDITKAKSFGWAGKNKFNSEWPRAGRWVRKYSEEKRIALKGQP